MSMAYSAGVGAGSWQCISVPPGGRSGGGRGGGICSSQHRFLVSLTRNTQHTYMRLVFIGLRPPPLPWKGPNNRVAQCGINAALNVILKKIATHASKAEELKCAY
jgi:hypothetical protein